jgi:LysM repeat protein
MKSRFTIYPLFILLATLPLFLKAQPALNPAYIEYIETYREIAVKKMHEFGIPASITLAQGILESGSGKSALAVEAKNHFGIKCHKEWTGMTYTMDDDTRDECFRKYASAEESFNDHSLFLTTRARYANLFTLDLKDYKGWAYGLKSAGYATNPKYAEILIRIIEENELYLYDNPSTSGAIAQKHDKKEKETKKDNKPTKNQSSTIRLSAGKLKFEEIFTGNRPVYLNNGVKVTFARSGDNAQTLADDFGIHAFQILKYNELGKNEAITEGQAIYIVPKKNKSKERSEHRVSEGETIREIAQFYGIKLKSIYRINKMQSGHEPKTGTVIKLRR